MLAVTTVQGNQASIGQVSATIPQGGGTFFVVLKKAAGQVVFKRDYEITAGYDANGDGYRDEANGSGDVNYDNAIDLTDAIVALQVVSGIQPAGELNPAASVTPGSPIGISSAINALCHVALR